MIDFCMYACLEEVSCGADESAFYVQCYVVVDRHIKC